MSQPHQTFPFQTQGGGLLPPRGGEGSRSVLFENNVIKVTILCGLSRNHQNKDSYPEKDAFLQEFARPPEHDGKPALTQAEFAGLWAVSPGSLLKTAPIPP